MIRWIKNYKESSKKLTYKNIRNYLVAMYKWYTASDKDRFQFYNRVVSSDKDCLRNGYCPCFCDVPQKFMEPEKCEENCYNIWLTKKEFLDKIKKENINLSLLEKQAKLLLKENNLKNPYDTTGND